MENRKNKVLNRIDRIADDFRRRITTGQLQEGESLPTMREIAAEYEVSISSVQLAIRQLRNEGLVFAQHAKGVFVGQGGLEGGSRKGRVRFIIGAAPSKRIPSETLREIIRPFQLERRDIDIAFLGEPTFSTNLREIRERLVFLLNTGQCSLRVCGGEDLKTLACQNALADVTDYLEDWSGWDSIHPAMQDAGAWQGRIYGMPWSSGVNFLVGHGPSLAKVFGSLERGLEHFGCWDDISGGKVAVAAEAPVLLYDLWLQNLVQGGLDPFESEHVGCPALLNPPGIEALNRVRGLLREGSLVMRDWSDRERFFASWERGEDPVRLTLAPSNVLGMAMGRGWKKEDMVLLPLPRFTGKRNLQMLISLNYVFSPVLKERDLAAAVDLAKHLTSPKVRCDYVTRLYQRLPERFPLHDFFFSYNFLAQPPFEVPTQWREALEQIRADMVPWPTAPFWTYDVFESEMAAMARDPNRDIAAMIQAHLPSLETLGHRSFL